MNRNSILLRRRHKVIVPRGDSFLPAPYVATNNKNPTRAGRGRRDSAERVAAAFMFLDYATRATLTQDGRFIPATARGHTRIQHGANTCINKTRRRAN